MWSPFFTAVIEFPGVKCYFHRFNRLLLLLPPVTQSSPHPRYSPFRSVPLLLVSSTLSQSLLVGVVGWGCFFFYRVMSVFQLYVFYCSVILKQSRKFVDESLFLID